ncbi:UDP-glycosyltransferase 203B1-like protein, partial [Dinothrombium tinctorium]
ALEKSQEMFAIEANKWLKEQDVPPLPKNSYRHFSTNLNVYIFPKPLMEDYLRLCELGDEWFGLDQSIRESKESFKMPENFKTENEKLIYFSMGSFGSNVVELMSRLLKILAKCKHKIIVVTGNFKDKLELADNMWGDSFLPQLEILPLVDLVITHGGNNTFVETLYFGKPMIVMPLFADQHDNARRAVETKIGPAFNPFTVEESELLNAIDATLNDSETPKRIKIISEQIRESNAMDVLSQKLVQIARNPKFPTVM